jgi:hypothetical protein
LKAGIILHLANQSAVLYNGGDVPFIVTNLCDVAKGVLGVVEHLGETENRIVYVHSALVTQNRLMQFAEEKDGKA